MAVYFKDFDKARDWRTLVEDLSLASASAILSFNPVNLYKGAKDAVVKSAPTPGTDERAGIWLRVTATSALLDLLNDPAHGGPIRDDRERRDAAKVFVNEHLTLDGSVPFEPAALDNLGGSPALATVRADLPSLVPTADAEALRLAYDARLRKNTARVFALDPDLYGPLAADAARQTPARPPGQDHRFEGCARRRRTPRVLATSNRSTGSRSGFRGGNGG